MGWREVEGKGRREGGWREVEGKGRREGGWREVVAMGHQRTHLQVNSRVFSRGDRGEGYG